MISLTCNEAATLRYREYADRGLDWLGRIVVTEVFAELAAATSIQIVLRDQFLQVCKYLLRDPDRQDEYHVVIQCRRMGMDNGKDQLVHVTSYLQRIRDHVRKTARKLTPEEAARARVVASRR